MPTFQHSLSDLKPHIVSLGNNGLLMADGSVGNTQTDLLDKIRRLVERTDGWATRRVMLYAHGGVVGEASAVRWVDENLDAYLNAGIYPLCFIWHSDPWSTFKDAVWDAFTERSRAIKGFGDILNRAIEDIIRQSPLIRKASWLEMKDNATKSSLRLDGGARLVLTELAKLHHEGWGFELHLAGHSAGGVFHAPLIQLAHTHGTISGGPADGQTGYGLPVESLTLWAPGCTVDVYRGSYAPALSAKALKRMALFTLTDDLERKDAVAQLSYGHSILYLVSNGFEGAFETPILGMEKFVTPDIAEVPGMRWVRSVSKYSKTKTHGGFDDDAQTRRATIEWIRDGAIA